MKHLITIILLALVFSTPKAQTADTAFAKQWQVIDSLIVKNNLPKSALTKVNAVYAAAKQRTLPAQVIKALLYKLSLQEKTNDEDINVNIAAFTKEIVATSNPTSKSILQVLLAETLSQYYSNNQWQIDQRSTTTNFKKEDVATWGQADFYNAIDALYKKALTPAGELQNTLLQTYSAIIIKGNTPQLRPTLYDLSANEALDFYKEQSTNQPKPAQAFTLTDTLTLAPAMAFASHTFATQDTISFLFKELQLYQQIIQFHLSKNDTAALIDADINRVTWVHDNAAFGNKDAVYKNALTSITQKYTDHPQAAQAWYLLLSLQNDAASKYNAFTDTANRYLPVTIRQAIKERLAAQPAESEGNSNMRQLLQQIEAKELHTQAESVNVPGMPFRLLVQYKNVDTLYVRLLNKKQVDAVDHSNDSLYWALVALLPPAKTFIQALPQTNDYRQHGVEIKVDALPAGEYVLFAGNTNNFAATGRLLMQTVKVSHLAYVHKSNDYFVVDRESGKPLAGVKVKAVLNYYNRASSKQATKTLFDGVADKQGRFKISSQDKDVQYGNIAITLTDGTDVLQSGENEVYYRSETNNKSILTNAEFEKNNAQVHFYTDRAIYRPGQKVFFKGIATTLDAVTNVAKLYLPADSLKFYLRDVNWQNIDSINAKVNEYGSITGSFILPAQALTGQFSLTVKNMNGQQNIRVEEYKRPTFYVQLDTLKSAYRLKDNITVTGFAQAFAGNFLNNATVKYTVQRNTRNTIYDWGFKRYPRNNNSKQITQGTVTTDATGKFTFTFPAEPDETTDTSTNPVFDFSINVSITDAGGETREGSSTLSVGYSSLTVAVNMPAVTEIKKLAEIPVSVQNLNGKPVDAAVHIAVYPLQSNGRAVRKRYWDRPDVFTMSKEDFIKSFPYDEYENESDAHTWQKGAAIINDTFNTNNVKAYSLKQSVLQQGWYAVEASTIDKDGRIVKTVSYTEVYDAATTAMPATEDNFNIPVKTLLHPGETACLFVGSSFSDVYVLQQVDRLSNKNTPTTDVLKLDDTKKQIQAPVTEADRGGFGISYGFVKHNRFYTGSQVFSVPYDNKELDVRYTTFRNKTEPGSKEQWTVQVKGNDSTNKPAELLTTMYDASLDEFVQHSWDAPGLWPGYYGNNNWQQGSVFNQTPGEEYFGADSTLAEFDETYDRIVLDAEDLWRTGITYQYELMNAKIGTVNQEGMVSAPAPLKMPGERVQMMQWAAPKLVAENRTEANDMNPYRGNEFKSNFGRLNYARTYMLSYEPDGDSTFYRLEKIPSSPPLQLRTNFNETAFFFPQLYPDSAGNYTINFTMPESLTKWKWLTLAHTKDLAFGTNAQNIVTQKTLMVQPNMPRFLREGDQLELTARISNTGDTALTGQVELQLLDAETGNAVDGLFHNVFPNQYFTSEARQTSVVKFPIAIPYNYTKPLTYRIVAKTASFNDGEENTLPVLTNRMLVTESLPLYLKGDTTKHFTFDKLKNNHSETLRTQSLTVEYTANPVWNAIQALPYLMEYPYECAEQTFNRFYANALAANIVAQHPRIKQVFDAWLKASPVGGRLEGAALVSNLEKNQELKQVILEETPWVLDAQNEAQQKKNLALLFDMVKMADGAQSALQKLQDMQQEGGGFAWFKGGYADRYITQYILTGIGRLQQMHAVPGANSSALNNMITKALSYLDNEANADYKNLVKSKADLSKDNLSQTDIQYLFMRSYFSTLAISNKQAYNYYYQQAMKYWQTQSEYMKGMISMTLLRTNQKAYALNKIYRSIVENAVTTAERGMYWKNNEWGYYWYQSPIEQQALLIELAEGLGKKTDANEMRTWLINQKQTTNWRTTKATADAIYALLLNNNVQVDEDRKVTIQLGDKTISNTGEHVQAGTGYFKQVLQQKDVTPAMGNITVSVSTPGSVEKNAAPSYGAVYWQYFEDMDKITQATTSLSLHKKLFVENNTAAGRVLTPVDGDSVLHVGNKVIVRIELKVDRDLEYIHLKDMRAAAMEPVNVLSEYKWQDGLGYYESTKDVATDFFISYMPKGTYVFEYPVYITHTGTFSAGTANVQCMYAPEFASHSEGMRITVE